ncbi:DUF6274 family protein [Streptomyces sp. NPDC007346]|uniref:DUF6274 family protein n=1 Tax=Streptomyces sp. NPDC007346 TaxID=3154682 RepID=UPI003455B51D
MSASTARHETRALLRAHLAAAYGYGHLTRHCPVCHRLLRLAMEPGEGDRQTQGPRESSGALRGPVEPGAAPQTPRSPQPPQKPNEPYEPQEGARAGTGTGTKGPTPGDHRPDASASGQ